MIFWLLAVKISYQLESYILYNTYTYIIFFYLKMLITATVIKLNVDIANVRNCK